MIKDDVNHPAHYTDGKIEVIEFIEDKNLNFHLGNAVKYICRAGKKSKETKVKDLQKAVWYLKREIQRSMNDTIVDSDSNVDSITNDPQHAENK